MADIKDYGEFETAWCPGCGNFSILKALKQALAGLDLAPRDLLLVSGIGQAAKTPHYLKCNAFNGLHGRSLPAATGAALANPELKVLVHSGDGCHYGEGGNHFLAAVRRNVNLTVFVHDNQVYGLTKGQASPTSGEGFTTKAQPTGVHSHPFEPLAVALTLGAGFVARGFAGEVDHLAGLMAEAINHRGFALVDILQPCVSFNKVNTFKWYKDRVRKIGEEHDPTDWHQALAKSLAWGDEIPIGVIYRQERPSFEEHFPVLAQGPLANLGTDYGKLAEILGSYA
ncbi:MAG: 2-oxoacid:ferredoxin oxidoreductase subunit beta [Deltaproteobacteria bacterium]|nr:2-oxoacid:ferredoxin oxidoreductase subunit beta [Deltaproteobacteria bacterium]